MIKYITFCGLLLSHFAYSNEAFVSISGGHSLFTGSCQTHATNCDDQAWSYKTSLTYQYDNHVSLTASYSDYGRISAQYPALENSNQQALYHFEVDALDAAVTYQHHMMSDFIGYVGLGAVYWDASYTGREVSFTVNDDKQSTSATVLAGIILPQLHDNWRLSLDYQWVDQVGSNRFGETDISSVWLSLHYRFYQN